MSLFSFGTLKSQLAFFISWRDDDLVLSLAKDASKPEWRDDYLGCCNSLIRVNPKHSADQVQNFFGKVKFLTGIISIVDLFVELLVSWTFEGENTCQGNKGQYTKSPNVSRLSSVLLFLNDFRRHVTRSSTEYFNLNKVWSTFLLFSMQVLNPKSIILGDNSSPRITFSSLMSLWEICL